MTDDAATKAVLADLDRRRAKALVEASHTHGDPLMRHFLTGKSSGFGIAAELIRRALEAS